MSARGTLYVLATPIGNLGDITLRAVEVLRLCSVVAAEDTRRTRGLLSHLGLAEKSLVSLHSHSDESVVARIADRLAGGEDVAIVSDAGTPLVSDPGAELVSEAIERGIAIVPVPGASSILAALVGSGFSANRFRFLGFLPRSGTARTQLLEEIHGARETVLFFEAPNRTQETLSDLARLMPGRPACVARELTKIHEEFLRGSVSELAARMQEVRGEVVLVLGPWTAPPPAEVSDAELVERARAYAGQSTKSTAAQLAMETGRRKQDVYAVLVRARR